MQYRKSPVFAFFVILIGINLMLFSIVYTAGRYDFHPGKIVPLMLFWFTAVLVTGFVFSAALKSYIGIIVPFLGLMASMGAGVLFMDAFRLIRGPYAADVSVAEAPAYKDAAVLYFRDGKILKECMGEYETYDDNVRSTYYAVPYVGGGWTKKDPVTVWITCVDNSASCLNSTGIAMVSKYYRAGMDEAEKKCGIKSHPAALRVEWIGLPYTIIDEGTGYLKMFAAGINGLWVIVFIIQYVRIRREA